MIWRSLRIAFLGLMLACGSAYASEPPSPAPAIKSQANAADPAQNDLASADVGDIITDAGIGLLALIAGLFVSISFLESRKKRRE